MSNAQVIAEIQADADRRIAAIRKAEKEAAAVVEENRRSEEQKRQEAERAALVAKAAADWESENLQGLRKRYSEIVDRMVKLRTTIEALETGIDFVMEEYPALHSELMGFGDQIATDRFAMPDCSNGYVDLQGAIHDAIDAVIDSCGCVVGPPQWLYAMMRDRVGLGMPHSVSHEIVYQWGLSEAAELAKKIQSRQ